MIPLCVFTSLFWMPSHYQLCLSRVLQSQLPPKAKLMASPNVLPQTRSDDPPVAVSRTQLPLLPRKQCTLHGMQGTTAEPGLIAHWTPANTPGASARQSAAVSGEGSRRYLTLYFSQVTGEIHGPMHFAPDERVEQIQHWLEHDTFRSRCVDEETNECLAHAQISTSCGMVLDQCRNLDDYPVCDGDTLTVIVVPADDLSVLEAEVRESA